MTGHTAHVDYKQVVLLVFIVLAVVVIKKVPGMISALLKTFFKEMLLIYIWRHFSGAHYHGERKTDATWFQHGSTTKRQYDKDGFMSRWEHKPRAHRALWRWGCTIAFVGMLYGLIADRIVTEHAVDALAVYGVVVAGFVIEVKVRLRVHDRHVLTPIVKSLAPYLKLSPHAVRRMLHIHPENISEDGEIGYFEIPDEITPGDDQQTGMSRIIDAHLPLDTELEFKLQQQPRIAVIKAAQKPPAMVLWDETIEAMEHAAAGDIVIGKDRHKNIFTANFVHLDDPHWAFCVQSKRGKSNFLGLVCVQVLHQDPAAQVIAVDPKRSSLIDYLGSPDYPGTGLKPLLPGVTMANDPTRPEEMVAAIGRAKKLFDQRSEEASRDRTKQFPICLVAVDELNLLREIIQDMWSKELAANKRRPKEDRDDLPNECPIWPNIRTLLQAGRFVGIHVIAVAQDFRDDAIGGKGGRSYFGLRGLGGYHANQWKMLVDTTPVPIAQKGVGRWIFTQSEQQDWVQITHADPGKAYEWASHGRLLHVPEAVAVPSVPEAESAALTASTLQLEADRRTDPDPRIIGIAAAAEYLGMKEEAFDKARVRYKKRHKAEGLPGETSAGNRPAWYPADLTAWNDSRPGNKRRNSG